MARQAERPEDEVQPAGRVDRCGDLRHQRPARIGTRRSRVARRTTRPQRDDVGEHQERDHLRNRSGHCHAALAGPSARFLKPVNTSVTISMMAPITIKSPACKMLNDHCFDFAGRLQPGQIFDQRLARAEPVFTSCGLLNHP